MSDIKTAMVPVTEIVMDPITQPRATMDINIVHEYATLMKDGTNFPPIVVFENDAGELILADGWYRMLAKKQAGIADVLAEIRQGDIHDAIEYAAGANATHGLRRTNEDKHRAVAMLLDDDRWQSLSARQIAEAAKVDHKTVIRIREERDVEKSPRPDDEPETRTDTMGRQQPAKKKKKPKQESGQASEEPSTEDMTQADMERPTDSNPALDTLRSIAALFTELPREPAEAVDELLEQGHGHMMPDRANHIAWWFQTYADYLNKLEAGEGLVGERVDGQTGDTLSSEQTTEVEVKEDISGADARLPAFLRRDD